MSAGHPSVLETAVIGVPDENGKKSSSPMCSHDLVRQSIRRGVGNTRRAQPQRLQAADLVPLHQPPPGRHPLTDHGAGLAGQGS